MPGRKVSAVHNLFNVVTKEGVKGKRAICKYCLNDVADNGTRKLKHITDCIKCPDDVKFEFIDSSQLQKKVKSTVTPVNAVILSTAQSAEQEVEPAEITLDSDDEPVAASTPIRATATPVKQPSADLTGIEPIFLSNFGDKSMSNPPARAKSSCTNISDDGSKKQTQSTLKSLMQGTCIDKISPFQNDKVSEHLARAIFASGCPLSLVENEYWMKFFSAIRPAYKPPSRYKLTTEYLNDEFNRINDKCTQLIRETSSVGLMCDGWTNIRNEAIINFIVTTPQPIFWKSLATGAESHTGYYMCNQISKVIDEVGPAKVTGLCSDNAANMKKAWELLELKYSHLNCYGCLAHGLNCIFTDAIKIKSFSNVLTQCTSVIKCIKGSHALQAKFVEKQQGMKAATTLKLPVKTRWGSSVPCLKSMMDNKHALKTLAIDETMGSVFQKDKVALVLNDVFWDKIKGFHSLLSPIADTIKKVEGDEPSLSDTVPQLNRIVEIVKQNLASSPMLKAEEELLCKIIEKRREFCLKRIHLAANLIDPRYRGEPLTRAENVDAFEKIYELGKSMNDVDDKMMMAELTNYSSKSDFFSKEFLWVAVDKVSPIAWWSAVCKGTELSKVAIRVLGLPATSAACERSFSAQGNIHSKKRNRLTHENTAKLVYVSQNLALVPVPHVKPGTCSSVVASTSGSSAVAVASASDVGPSTAAGPSMATGPSMAGVKRKISEVLTESESDTNSSCYTALVYDDESDMSLTDLVHFGPLSPEL